MAHKDHGRYAAACNFPGTIDEGEVERQLGEYLRALSVQRKIVRLGPDWLLDEQPALKRYVNAVLDDFAGRPAGKEWRDARAALDARDARAARDALDARAARDARDGGRDVLQRFAAWCIQAYGWSYWRFDLSWISTTHFGAKTDAVRSWSTPLFEAYVAGCWMLHWTDDTLYWVAKPTVHVERTTQGARRLHNEAYAALESDVENIYFWHGVLVPAFVVVRPDWITLKHIEGETNAEVRRIMIERYGYERYLRESDAKLIDSCQDDHKLKGMRTAKLWNAGGIVFLDLLNSTPEPDGTTKRYVIPVDAERYGGRAGRECIAASASTWRKRGDPMQLAFARPEDYAPAFES